MHLTLCASLHEPLTSPLFPCMPLDWFAVSDSFMCKEASTAISKQVATLAKVLRVLWSETWETCCSQRHARCYLAIYSSPCRGNAWQNSQSFLLAQRQQHRKQRLCRCSSRLRSWRLTCKLPQLGRSLPLTALTTARINSATAKGDPTCK